jgi:hypothetical protein
MRTSFQDRYPDFASVEYQIRQAHAERSLYIATAIANGIFAVIRGAKGLFASAQTPAKATVPHNAARV